MEIYQDIGNPLEVDDWDELALKYMRIHGWARVLESWDSSGHYIVIDYKNPEFPEYIKEFIENRKPDKIQIEIHDPKHFEIVDFNGYLEKYAQSQNQLWIDSQGREYEVKYGAIHWE